MTPLDAAFGGDVDGDEGVDGDGVGVKYVDSGVSVAGGEADGGGELGLRGERGESGGDGADLGEDGGGGVAAVARTGTASFMPPRQ